MSEKVLAAGIVLAVGAIFPCMYRLRRPLPQSVQTETSSSLRGAAVLYRACNATVLPVLLLSMLSCTDSLWLLHDHLLWRWFGVGLALAAVALFVAAMWSLGDAYRPCGKVALPTRLVQSGPYRWVRHPIYWSNGAYLVAVFLATGSAWLVPWILIYAVLLPKQALREGALLASAFPEYTSPSWNREISP